MSNAAEVLGSINNFFELEPVRGKLEVSGGELVVLDGDTPSLAASQYYLIRGSVLNDGLHEQGAEDLIDETAFTGEIVPCAVPRDLRELIGQIAEWRETNGEVGAYQSESFDGYSYSRTTSMAGAGITDWQSVFRTRLNRWRKL